MNRITRVSVLLTCSSIVIALFLWHSYASMASTGSDNTQKVLKYIARRENIPLERLFVVNEHRRNYPLLNRSFWFVTALDQEGEGHFYSAMLDLADDSVVEVDDIEAAEAKAQQARYGKLDPALYERLQTMRPNDTVEVAVWLTSPDYANLSAQVGKAGLELAERPWQSASDRATIAKMEAEYSRLLVEAHLEQQRPLANWLQSEGYRVKFQRGLPSLIAHLPKRTITKLTQRNDVTAVYLAEGELVLLLDAAIPTDRGDVVWKRGVNGSGVRVAVMEPGVVEDNASINVVAVRQVGMPVLGHTTRVASAVASHHPTLKGIAPEADIVSAAVQSLAAVDDAILWAKDQGAYIINASYTTTTGECSDSMEWIDRVADYYVRYWNMIIVVAAGNQKCGNHTGSPAKGYNVITVGAANDQDDANWSNDTMHPSSSWKNPRRYDGSFGDREKPEVVAPGWLVKLISTGHQEIPDTGTSFAAPQVAGLAALLGDRDSRLVREPEAVKAIIMASAVHNIEGASGIPTGYDLRDGAGAIDAAKADEIAFLGYNNTYQYPYPTCSFPCWWSNFIYNSHPDDPPEFPPGTYRFYYFNASAEDQVRVAITWDSNPIGPGADYMLDPLDTDLDLRIFDPDWQGLENIGGYSASRDNNYELVDFFAPKTGRYAIGVYKRPSSAKEYINWLGAAWTRVKKYDAAYLSHSTPGLVLPNQDYQVCFTVRNDGYWDWPSGGGNPVHLGYHWYNTGGAEVPVAADYRTSLPSNLPQGDSTTFCGWVRTPANLGQYTLKWDMVHEGVTWFTTKGDQPLSVQVNVVDTIYPTYLPIIFK